MKKSLALLAGLALCAANPALAARGGTLAGVQFGVSVPTGDFFESSATGCEAGLVGTYMLSERGGIGVDVAYHSWVASTNAIQITPHVYATGKAGLYAKAGGGLYWVKSNGDDTQTKVGLNVGAGFHFTHSHEIGIGGTYHIIQTSGYTTQLFMVSVNLLTKRSAR